MVSRWRAAISTSRIILLAALRSIHRTPTATSHQARPLPVHRRGWVLWGASRSARRLSGGWSVGGWSDVFWKYGSKVATSIYDTQNLDEASFSDERKKIVTGFTGIDRMPVSK